MAETKGFEPSIPFNGYTPLAGERLRPLGHVSAAENVGIYGAMQGLTGAIIPRPRQKGRKSLLAGLRPGLEFGERAGVEVGG